MRKISGFSICLLIAFLITAAIAATHPVAPIVPTMQQTQPANGAAVVLNSNTLIAYWLPSTSPNVLSYCIYRSQISGKETKSDCFPVAQLKCPVYTPPLNPGPPPNALCWSTTVPLNTSKLPRTFFIQVTTVAESAKSNEAQAIQNPGTPNTNATPASAVTVREKPTT
jgi:hypothetical protein